MCLGRCTLVGKGGQALFFAICNREKLCRRQGLRRCAHDIYAGTSWNLHNPGRRSPANSASKIVWQRVADLKGVEGRCIDYNDSEVLQAGIGSANLQQQIFRNALEHMPKALCFGDDAAPHSHPLAPPASRSTAAQVDCSRNLMAGICFHDDVHIAAPGDLSAALDKALERQACAARPLLIAEERHPTHPHICDGWPGPCQPSNTRQSSRASHC